MSICHKPGCPRPAAVVLAYDYGESRIVLSDPTSGQLDPHLYLLCNVCAERLRPPRGWDLVDQRSRPPIFTSPDDRRPQPAPSEAS